jgi:hypothetical protein
MVIIYMQKMNELSQEGGEKQLLQTIMSEVMLFHILSVFAYDFITNN